MLKSLEIQSSTKGLEQLPAELGSAISLPVRLQGILAAPHPGKLAAAKPGRPGAVPGEVKGMNRGRADKPRHQGSAVAPELLAAETGIAALLSVLLQAPSLRFGWARWLLR